MPELGEGLGWVLAVNLVLWTGLFLYMLRLQGRVRDAERRADALEEEARRSTAGNGSATGGTLERTTTERNAEPAATAPGRPAVPRETAGSER